MNNFREKLKDIFHPISQEAMDTAKRVKEQDEKISSTTLSDLVEDEKLQKSVRRKADEFKRKMDAKEKAVQRKKKKLAKQAEKDAAKIQVERESTSIGDLINELIAELKFKKLLDNPGKVSLEVRLENE